MPDAPVHNASFTIVREFKAAPARVFAAHVETAAKRRWFVDAEGWETFEYALDVRPGGTETWRGSFQGGPEVRNNVSYYDVVANERLIFAYEMHIGGVRLSVSLATTLFEAHKGGTRLTYTEQGAYLDGADSVKGREIGCRELFEALAREVDG